MVSFLFHSMFKNDSCKMILLSSSTRGSKLILKRWFAHLTGLTLDCQTCPVSVLHLKASQTWFYSGLTLENWSNLVLFRSYTWKLVKLGSVSVLHLKANQTLFCSSLALASQSNLVLKICLLTWTYPWLPVWLCFGFTTHICLIGLTTLMPWRKGFKFSSVGIWASLKTLICLNYLLSPWRSF